MQTGWLVFQERTRRLTVEEIADVLLPQIQKQTAEVLKDLPQQRMSERIMAPVTEEVVEAIQCRRNRLSKWSM